MLKENIKIVELQCEWHNDDSVSLQQGSKYQFIEFDKVIFLVTNEFPGENLKNIPEGSFYAIKFNKETYEATVDWKDKKPVKENIQPTLIEQCVIQLLSDTKIPRIGKVIKSNLSNATADNVEDFGVTPLFKVEAFEEDLVDSSKLSLGSTKRSGNWSKPQTYAEKQVEKMAWFGSCFDDNGVISSLKLKAQQLAGRFTCSTSQRKYS
ncbi:hypothetical protein [Roseofilum sp. Belize Diploria]|uniref:hypothetical protein n=1 Tax=Roseofilum sp. Belize Diploria TaxID=2821501 RepID=UPI001B2202DA|nr:hypothetical protein [Roseofilum sp. Belize Diploria]MBP0010118.1 hypothetical protein [Roseofilum sp. Belize Diploria]